MTDKEQINDSLKNQNKNFNENFTCENRTVIIDGVDVSKCKYFEDGECGCEYYLRYGYEITMYDRCEEYPNCDFKQLARKTQECENLKEDYKELEQRHNEAFQEFERLKQEYEEMKKASLTLAEGLNFRQNKLARYRKALEEVEEYWIHYLKHNPKSPSIDLNVILDIINKARRK